MSTRPRHSRRLSLFALRASKSFDSEELTPVQNSECSVPFHAASTKSKADAFPENGSTLSHQSSFNKGRSRNKKSKAQLNASHPPSSFASQSKISLASTRVSDSSHSYNDGATPSLKRNRSLNLKVALANIFAPKPSRSKIVGILHEVEDHKSSRKIGRGIGNDRSNVQSYVYVSRSPSPPSPEIRPPSGLGQIASSVNLSAYVEEEREASLMASLSRPESLVPSLGASTFMSPCSNNAPSLASVSINDNLPQDAEEIINTPVSKTAPPSKPSATLVEALALSANYCPLNSLASLLRANREFLAMARSSLYSDIDSDSCHSQEARRTLLETLASKNELSMLVKKFRWVCQTSRPSSPLALSPKHSIPRRAPNVSLSSSPEEFILPLVLSSMSNITTLDLVHPPVSILRSFLPKRSSRRSPTPNLSPISTPDTSNFLPMTTPFKYLHSLTLSGRTTLSSAFGDVLTRFLEQFPTITDLCLPDVFCLPIVTPLIRTPSQNSSSDKSSNSSGDIPPVPPLPAALVVPKEKEAPPSILPNLQYLKAPLTLATQLVPGRPLRCVDVELATSVYEGLRPADAARSLGAAEGAVRLKTPTTPNDGTDWRSARHARRTGLPSPNTFKAPTLKVLRIRCTAKVDGRTIGRMLGAVASEVGSQLEHLAIGWSGTERDLLSQLTQCLARFTALQHLELSSLADSADVHSDDDYQNEDNWHGGNSRFPVRESLADLQAGMALEQNYVEQWARLCPSLSYMEFASHRVWKAR